MNEVAAHIAAIDDEKRRQGARQLLRIFQATSGYAPHLWGGRLIGFGTYDYTYASGRSGTFIATGFSVLASKYSLHILPGYADFTDITNRLGKVKSGKSCIYVNKLDDIDQAVLPELIHAGLDNLARLWPVKPT